MTNPDRTPVAPLIDLGIASVLEGMGGEQHVFFTTRGPRPVWAEIAADGTVALCTRDAYGELYGLRYPTPVGWRP